MSIRGLFGTTTTALTSAVTGTVKLGNAVGEVTTYISRKSKELNHKDTIRMEELRRKEERTKELANMFGTDDVQELKDSIKQLEDFYDEIFK